MGDNDADATTTAAAPTSEAAPVEPSGDYPPVPTAEALNEELMRGLDPAVPVEEKAMLIQGAEEDPELINQVAAAAVQNGAQIEITSVDDLGDGHARGSYRSHGTGLRGVAVVLALRSTGVPPHVGHDRNLVHLPVLPLAPVGRAAARHR